MNRSEIHVGQRVSLVLPAGPHGRDSRVAGTVEGIDTAGHPGVRVRLDRVVSGVDNCYATYHELDPEVVNLQ
jgi:hypothetical protein